MNSMKGKAICRVTVLFCAMKWLSMFDMSRYKDLKLFSTPIRTIKDAYLFLTAKQTNEQRSITRRREGEEKDEVEKIRKRSERIQNKAINYSNKKSTTTNLNRQPLRPPYEHSYGLPNH